MAPGNGLWVPQTANYLKVRIVQPDGSQGMKIRCPESTVRSMLFAVCPVKKKLARSTLVVDRV